MKIKGRLLEVENMILRHAINRPAEIELSAEDLIQQLSKQGGFTLYGKPMKEVLDLIHPQPHPESELDLREKIARILFNAQGVSLSLDGSLNLADQILSLLPKLEVTDCKTCKRPDFNKSGHNVDEFYKPDKFPKMFPISACCNSSVKEHTIYTCEACGQICKLSDDFKPDKECECNMAGTLCPIHGEHNKPLLQTEIEQIIKAILENREKLNEIIRKINKEK